MASGISGPNNNCYSEAVALSPGCPLESPGTPGKNRTARHPGLAPPPEILSHFDWGGSALLEGWGGEKEKDRKRKIAFRPDLLVLIRWSDRARPVLVMQNKLRTNFFSPPLPILLRKEELLDIWVESRSRDCNKKDNSRKQT